MWTSGIQKFDAVRQRKIAALHKKIGDIGGLRFFILGESKDQIYRFPL